MKMKTFMGAMLLMMGIGVFSSCKEDQEPKLPDVAINNQGLKDALVAKGFQFSADGKLIRDAKVKGTTTLDLSGQHLTSVAGLDAFPNLQEVNLQNNEFGHSFDFSQLPKSVTKVDLTNNDDLFEYPGLVDLKIEKNGEEHVTVLHELTSLKLPLGAKYNCDVIPSFYVERKDKGLQMQMQNKEKQLQPYTTLREVPDKNTLAALKHSFPSLFTKDDKIDLTKRLTKATEIGAAILIAQKDTIVDPGKPAVIQEKPFKVIDPGVSPTTNTLYITSAEGAQYVAMNPSYRGTSIKMMCDKSDEIPYLKVKSNVGVLGLQQIAFKYLNMSDVKDLYKVALDSISGVKSLDFSKTVIGTRGKDIEIATFKSESGITAKKCKDLEEIILPDNAKYVDAISADQLPKLKSLDLSRLLGTRSVSVTSCSILPTLKLSGCSVRYLSLGDLPACTGLTYPSAIEKTMDLAITKDVYNLPVTKAFLDKFHSKIEPGDFDFSKLESVIFWGGEYNEKYEWAE